MRSTSWTPSSTSISARVELPVAADGADDRPQRAGRAVHVEAHLDELRDHALDLLFGRAFFHHDNHEILFASERCRSASMTPLCAADAPLSV